jgi:hypothetical protein
VTVAGVVEELACQLRRSTQRILDGLQPRRPGIVLAVAIGGALELALHARQQVVEVAGDAAGQQSEALEALRAQELELEAVALLARLVHGRHVEQQALPQHALALDDGRRDRVQPAVAVLLVAQPELDVEARAVAARGLARALVRGAVLGVHAVQHPAVVRAQVEQRELAQPVVEVGSREAPFAAPVGIHEVAVDQRRQALGDGAEALLALAQIPGAPLQSGAQHEESHGADGRERQGGEEARRGDRERARARLVRRDPAVVELVPAAVLAQELEARVQPRDEVRASARNGDGIGEAQAVLVQHAVVEPAQRHALELDRAPRPAA